MKVFEYLVNGQSAEAVKGQATSTATSAAPAIALAKPETKPMPIHSSAQSQLSTEDIEFFYDMEFFINRQLGGTPAADFDEDQFRKALSVNGDSIIVISDDETIKVHVHPRHRAKF